MDTKELTISNEILSSLVLNGDISKMDAMQKVQYYNTLCDSLGLNPVTKPFQIIKFQGKEVLYATKDCTEQLRKQHGISIIDQTDKIISDIYIVNVRLQDAKGRIDTGKGAVNIKGLSGDNLANAMMKAETKAKRRGTLSICGLGMLDETELETIPGVKPITPEPPELPPPTDATDPLDSISDKLKEGFRILGWNRGQVRSKCEMYEYEEAKILADINSIIDKKEEAKLLEV